MAIFARHGIDSRRLRRQSSRLAQALCATSALCLVLLPLRGDFASSLSAFSAVGRRGAVGAVGSAVILASQFAPECRAGGDFKKDDIPLQELLRAPVVGARDGFIQTPLGLQYKVVQEGTGEDTGKRPQSGDACKLKVTGWLNGFPGEKSPTGQASFQYLPIQQQAVYSDDKAGRGATITMEMVDDRSVLPGWNYAMKDMRKGEKRRLIVPPSLAYGDEGNALIAPSSTLYFDIELKEFVELPQAPPMDLGVPNFQGVIGAYGDLFGKLVRGGDSGKVVGGNVNAVPVAPLPPDAPAAPAAKDAPAKPPRSAQQGLNNLVLR